METALSASEQAFFESGGVTEVVDTPEVVAEGAPQVDLAAATGDGQQPDGQLQTEQPDQQDGLDRDEKGRFVPHQALHAEREEHKKTKAQVAAVEQQLAVLNDRWNTLLTLRQQQEQPKQEEQPPPNPEEDIFGYAKWQAEKVKALEDKLNNQETQTRQQQEVAQQEQAIWNEWSQSAQSYAAQKPDFGDAIKWLSDFRGKQLSAMAMIDDRFSTPQGVNEQINQELRAIVLSAKQKGVNPAEVVHQIALSYGFQAKAPDPANVDLPEKLAGIASAQEAARTVGQVTGRTGGDAMTPESIAAMPPAEFERWAADPKNARLLDKMLGA